MDRKNNRLSLPSQASAAHFALWDHFQEFLSQDRQNRLIDVLSRRTRYLTVVLDDVRQSHNVSAVLRSCDAFGLQDVHVMETVESFDPATKIALGSERWLTLHQYQGATAVTDGIQALKQQGYQLIATVPPGPRSQPFDQINLDRPTAIIFGNEKFGVSQPVLEAADGFATIPMYGFVESLNISVACALFVQSLSSKLRETDIPWGLSDAEKEVLLFEWTRKSVPAVEMIEQRWLARNLERFTSEGQWIAS